MRHKCLILCLFLAFFLFGCQDASTPETETTGESLPQALLSERLSVEEGNFSRANKTGRGNFFEIESGYYYVHNRFLYYADKTDLTNWVPVCIDPECTHDDNSVFCTADTHYGMFLSDNRFYFVADTQLYPHLYPGDPDVCGFMLCSMAYNGTDLRFEHLFEEALAPGGSMLNAAIFPDGYALFASILDLDGSAKEMIFYKDSSVEKSFWSSPGNPWSFLSPTQPLFLWGSTAIMPS